MLQNFQVWLAQPFQSGMSAPRWFAFVGLLMASVLIWGLIQHRALSA